MAKLGIQDQARMNPAGAKRYNRRMSKRRWLWIVSCLAPACAAALAGMFLLKAQEGAGPHPDTQKLILENQFVRVWDIHVPPGVFEPKHSHGRGLTIAMSDYDNETKSIPDGKVSRGHTKFGEVRWVEPVTHEARNTGSTEQHVVRIELK
jgi:hypothetical protein